MTDPQRRVVFCNDRYLAITACRARHIPKNMTAPELLALQAPARRA